MKYIFSHKLEEGILTGKRGNDQTIVVIDGKEVAVRCPAVAILNETATGGIPCLVAKDKTGDTEYTVVAVQGNGKEWVCVRQMLMEQAAGYFLENGRMGDIIGDGRNVIRAVFAEKYQADFQVANVSIEIKVLTKSSYVAGGYPCSWAQVTGGMKRFLARVKVMKESDSKMILLLVCDQEGKTKLTCDGKANQMLRRISKEGVEVWTAVVEMEADGISLQDYQRMTGV